MKGNATKRPRKLRSKKSGMAPGALVHLGEVKTTRPTISLMEFDAEELVEKRFTSIAESRAYQPSRNTLWLNVYGLHEPDVLAEIGLRFRLHPLVLEDILNTDQRPKMDDYGDYLFVVCRFFDYDAKNMCVASEQVSIVIGRNFVLTFQERPTGSFDPIRERLRAGKGLIRSCGADHLAYSLVDAIVDRYFVVLEELVNQTERTEDELMAHAAPAILQTIHQLKRETVNLRRAVWPLRDVINSLQRTESRFFTRETQLYLRDVYDHTVHVIESLEAIRDLIGDLLDMYLSSVSNRLNQEVRVLTVIATLFMPATLISGIFGMNFHAMPWVELPHGFTLALALMAAVALAMVAIFWRRKWLH